MLWKPPGTKAIGFHQDGSYADYLVPPEMVTCWIVAARDAGRRRTDRVRAAARTAGRAPPERSQFHAPEDWLEGARAATPTDAEFEIVPVVVKAGGGAFHHNLMWHGSAPNTSGAVARMALVSHMLPARRGSTTSNVDLIYSRYRRRGDLSMDESFFPVMWDETGYRTPWLAELPEIDN